ncbi:MAG: radical SAM/SPASM domain-containing protein [Bacillota bacterium]|jgi:MoaA/NifB/PqqE/SkfB family radical SAM enzyme
MEGIVAVTYRCNARCQMCHTWQYPTSINEEITPQDVEKLPGGLSFINITGGEPFMREDIEDIIKVLLPKTKRLVISTNGYLTERIILLARKYRQLGFRVSLEGLSKTNDALRGLEDGFDHGLRTLLELKQLGFRDIGFGITVSERNAADLMDLYRMAKGIKFEFATAVLHNSYYFHKDDNMIKDKQLVIGEFQKLIAELLKSKRIKDWFRAYFNYGVINYVNGGERLLPCAAGSDLFFLDPFGEIRPCNGMKETMGNIKKADFEDIWQSKEAISIREKVRCCTKNCWMVGTAAPAMKRNILLPVRWIVREKWFQKRNPSSDVSG